MSSQSDERKSVLHASRPGGSGCACILGGPGEVTPLLADVTCEYCRRVVDAWVALAPQMEQLLRADSFNRTVCGSPSSRECSSTGGSPGPCWEHRRLAIVSQLESAIYDPDVDGYFGGP